MIMMMNRRCEILDEQTTIFNLPHLLLFAGFYYAYKKRALLLSTGGLRGRGKEEGQPVTSCHSVWSAYRYSNKHKHTRRNREVGLIDSSTNQTRFLRTAYMSNGTYTQAEERPPAKQRQTRFPEPAPKTGRRRRGTGTIHCDTWVVESHVCGHHVAVCKLPAAALRLRHGFTLLTGKHSRAAGGVVSVRTQEKVLIQKIKKHL